MWFEVVLRRTVDQRLLGVLHNVDSRRKAEQLLRDRAKRLNEANEELALAARIKNEFTATMSHELRTPLNAILGYRQILLEELYGPLVLKQREALVEVEANGGKLLAIINGILDLSRIESGQETLASEAASVMGICGAAVQALERAANEKNLRLDVDLPDERLRVMCDPRRLRQVLEILLDNAIKFTPDGRVSLGVNRSEDGRRVRFEVRDTGIGIARKDQARIFEPFVQLDGSLSRRYGGAGLGLALAARLLRGQKGEVRVESRPGEGSCFIVEMPVAGAAAPKAEGDADVAGRTEAGLLRVLLVEDNPANMVTTRGYLEAKGFAVSVADSGEAALAIAEEESFDVVLMDVQMPGMDGLEATRRLKSGARNRNASVIALTALAMPGDREKCLEAGAEHYLSKPVKFRELADLIRRIASARRDDGASASESSDEDAPIFPAARKCSGKP